VRRDSKLVRGLVDWLLGGVSARLDFLEQDVESLQKDNKDLKQQVQSHQQQLQHHARQMIALRKMHALLAGKVDREFPGQRCEDCGSAMIFRREAGRNAYSLKCPNECGKTLIMPETLLLNTLKQLPGGSSAPRT